MTTETLVAADAAQEGVDPAAFRATMRMIPTPVTIVTAAGPDGAPLGLTIGSFVSVSLEPTLVSFCVMKSSFTWAAIRSQGRFAVNVLASDQATHCRNFSSAAADRFDHVTWSPGPHGLPLVEGSLAWLACEIDTVHEAGDHDLVIGRVLAVESSRDSDALVFVRGGFAAPASL
ncbi:flavin reductase family protein [Streptomyces sp. NPDC002346]